MPIRHIRYWSDNGPIMIRCVGQTTDCNQMSLGWASDDCWLSDTHQIAGGHRQDTSDSYPAPIWDASDRLDIHRSDSTFIRRWLDLLPEKRPMKELRAGLSSFIGRFCLIGSRPTRPTLIWYSPNSNRIHRSVTRYSSVGREKEKKVLPMSDWSGKILCGMGVLGITDLCILFRWMEKTHPKSNKNEKHYQDI